MNKPVRTGFFFGIGFGITTAIVTVAASVAGGYISELLFDSGNQNARYGNPTILSTMSEKRANQLIVLVTSRNEDQDEIYFYAEAALLGKDGTYIESCVGDRLYTIPKGEELRFRISCPTYGTEGNSIDKEVDEIKIQFFDDY